MTKTATKTAGISIAPMRRVASNAVVRVYEKYLPKIQKRDGRIVPFQFEKIVTVVGKAMNATGEGSPEEAVVVAHKVASDMMNIARKYKNFLPNVEACQDEVEKQLILSDYVATAKGFILYRAERARIRKEHGAVPEHVKQLAEESKKYFKNNPLGEFVFLRSYARWIEAEQRRETWVETVDRYINFMREKLGNKLTKREYTEVREAILNQEVMPSMRLMQFAGDPARRCNVCAYNCSFIAPSKLEDFAEIMYLSMCGTGVGFSVQSENIQQLPQIEKQGRIKLSTHVIGDSKEGWADALTLGLKTWYSGKDITFDYSQLRPAGARLKTMGGKSSGPDPLRSLLTFARETILRRQGRRLRNIDAHDIICKIGECVVSGGVRRSAMISLSDLDDVEMRDAKKGQFYLTDPHRSIANNSAVYDDKPTNTEFMDEWVALMKARTGERGIFNRGSLVKTLPERRIRQWKKKGIISENRVVKPIGTNPCVTGDTLVYVADGRGHVRIDQLAEEGKDIPVFCLDKKGSLVVRFMRNPRVTDNAADVYKITLDDGSTLEATENHKFRINSGGYREVQHLQHGDSLQILTKFEASIKDVFSDANSNSQDYWWINNGLSKNVAEHRPIAAFHYDTEISRGHVVHHKDRDAQNNDPHNLEIMSKESHDALHGDLMRGDANPMRRAHVEWSDEQWATYKQKHSINNAGDGNKNFSGISHEELKHHALVLTQKMGRRFSNEDWVIYAKDNGLPQAFSKWRKDHLGGIKGIATWAALECGCEHVNAYPRLVKSLKKYSEEGYDCEIVNGVVVIHKQCEVCSGAFDSDITHREYGVCSISCGMGRAWQNQEVHDRIVGAIRESHHERKHEVARRQAQVYSDLKFRLGRAPLKKEWRDACKDAGVSFEIARTTSPLRTYGALQELATMVNHKVVSVEYVGTRTVYNGTVDEFHNFFVGGFSSKTRGGKQKFAYVNNLQCGEIVLQSKEFCNLTEVIARSGDTEATLVRKAKLASLIGTYQSTLTNFSYLSKEWKENCESERLLGVSITGQWDSKVVRDPKVMRKMRKAAISANERYAKRFKVNTSTAITCVKPSGTVSKTFDTASGMHPRYAPHYIQRIRISATDSLFKMLKDQGVPYHPEVGQTMENANTFVLEFPVKAPEGSVFNNNLSALDQLEYWKMVKLNFTEHNPSVTISIGEGEWIAVAHWLYENWDIIGGLSFLPRSDVAYRLAPMETCDKLKYEELLKKMQNVDYSKIVVYEKKDETEQKKELACAGGVCEIL